MKDHRYLRAAQVIEKSITETGELPTITQLAKEGEMCDHVAAYCLQAWNAYYPTVIRLVARAALKVSQR